LKNSKYFILFGVIWAVLIIFAVASQPSEEHKSKERSLSAPAEDWENESNPRKKQWLEILYKQDETSSR
jgi:hypothetical protein